MKKNQTHTSKDALQKLLALPEVSSWRLLMGAFQSLYRQFEDGLQHDGLSYSRFQVLFLLYFEGPQAQINLAKKLHVSRSNISTLVKRMQHDKLIYATSTSTLQKRPKYALAPAGTKTFEEKFPLHIQRIKRIFTEKNLKDLKKLSHELETSHDSPTTIHS